jgi:uncharacterized DUF497 family protein
MEGFSFEWDAAKAQKNAGAHEVTFEEAITIFYDPLLLTFFDAEHSDDEERFQSVVQTVIAFCLSSKLIAMILSE